MVKIIWKLMNSINTRLSEFLWLNFRKTVWKINEEIIQSHFLLLQNDRASTSVIFILFWFGLGKLSEHDARDDYIIFVARWCPFQRQTSVARFKTQNAKKNAIDYIARCKSTCKSAELQKATKMPFNEEPDSRGHVLINY